MQSTARIIPLLLLSALTAACGDGAKSPAATESAPSTSPQAAGPRIISTVPAATLNLVLIGAADRLVGVSKYDRLYLPAAKQDLPIVGDYEDLNYEQLIKLKPTVLVIQKAPSRIPPRLKEVAAQQHIELLNMKFDHVEDIWTSVLALGKAAGREEATADAIRNAQKELKDLSDLYKDVLHPKVAYMANSKMIVGNQTFMDEMIVAAGGDNVGRGAGSGFLDINNEVLVQLAPEVLLVGAPGELPSIDNDPRLQPFLRLPIPAARNKRVYLITDGNSLDPSIDIGMNVRALAELIHKNPAAALPAATSTKPGGGP